MVFVLVLCQILIDGDADQAKDTEGYKLPSLVYLAREKRPLHFHNSKAGAMNALVSFSTSINLLKCNIYKV